MKSAGLSALIRWATSASRPCSDRLRPTAATAAHVSRTDIRPMLCTKRSKRSSLGRTSGPSGAVLVDKWRASLRAQTVFQPHSGHDMKNDTPGMKMTYAASGWTSTPRHSEAAYPGLARTTFRRGTDGHRKLRRPFPLEHGRYEEPLLVSSCDGVGTKLKVAS